MIYHEFLLQPDKKISDDHYICSATNTHALTPESCIPLKTPTLHHHNNEKFHKMIPSFCIDVLSAIIFNFLWNKKLKIILK